jgi:glycogen operon protein
MLLDGRAQTTGIRQRGKEATILLIVNGREDDVGFTMPACPGACGWSVLIDTNRPDLREFAESRPYQVGETYHVCGRSLLALVLESADTPGNTCEART